MGQARIKKLRQQAETERRKREGLPPEPVVSIPPSTPVGVRITINTDGISDEEKKTWKFQSAYQDMVKQLSVPGFIPVLCAHEAAHAVYFTLAGMKEFDPLPAYITFDPTINDYTGHLAAIKLCDIPTWTEGKFNEWFYKIAKGHAAGGVVARKLMPSSDGGDSDDKERFKKLCDKLNEDPKVKIDFDHWWNLAQTDIATELENPQFMDTILREAANLRPQFGL